MSPLHFVIMLIIAIIILTVLTLKFKMHPVMVLFLTATFCGLASGKTLVDTFSSITKYFGSTLGSIGVMIIFGAVIASGINDTGAATSMVNFFIKKFKGKCLELAPSLTGFIMSIPRLRRHCHHPERSHLCHPCQAQKDGYAAGCSLRQPRPDPDPRSGASHPRHPRRLHPSGR